MANLPNKPFVINYNARDYNPETRTIPRTSGQTLDQDMVFEKSTSSRYTNGPSAITQYDDHISFSAGTYSQFSFANGSSNPFNITSSNNNFTLVIKYYRNKDWTDPVYPSSPGTDVIMSREIADNTINFFLRCSDNDNGKQLQFNGANTNYITWSNYPVIEAVRMSGLTTTIMNLTDNIIGDPFVFSLKSNAANANRITFMGQNYASTATDVVGCIGGDFYWVYISREVLTDEEIQQVVKYNDSRMGITPDNADFAFTGGTASTVVESETPWSGATTSPWISFTPTTGASGTTTVTITASKNDFNSRTGKITFTDAEDNTAEFNITQGGTSGRVPNKKLYKGDRRLN